MIRETTVQLYEQYPPKPRTDGLRPSLAQLLHAVEVAGKFGVSRAELVNQLDLQPDLFDALVYDAGIDLR